LLLLEVLLFAYKGTSGGLIKHFSFAKCIPAST
jgi:hypothetical protein